MSERFEPKEFFKDQLENDVPGEVDQVGKVSSEREGESDNEEAKVFEFSERVNDKEMAERMAYSVKSTRGRSRELLRIADELMKEGKESEARIKTHEALEFEHSARGYEVWIARDLKKIEAIEKEGGDAKNEKKAFQLDVAEAYIGGNLKVFGSRYREMLKKLGIDAGRDYAKHLGVAESRLSHSGF